MPKVTAILDALRLLFRFRIKNRLSDNQPFPLTVLQEQSDLPVRLPSRVTQTRQYFPQILLLGYKLRAFGATFPRQMFVVHDGVTALWTELHPQPFLATRLTEVVTAIINHVFTHVTASPTLRTNPSTPAVSVASPATS
jgi:hypothetical protein